MRRLLYLLLVFPIVVALPVWAQSAEFNIRIFPGDEEAPTTPTILSAAPVTSSQIDIDWTDATDNFVVFGYVLFRDDVAIATTTLTNYSDTGLTASTTYTYHVYAFDPNGNYSSSSNQVSATTPAAPVPDAPEEVATSSTESTATRVVLDDVEITTDYTTAAFIIKTARPAKIELRWGRTTSYELGYVMNSAFLSEYKTLITGLEPGTTYEYQIIGHTPRGTETVLKSGQFTTTKEDVVITPSNVSRFRAEIDASDVRLRWELPSGDEIEHVRILRSHLGFPTHLYDGAVVYQGLGTETLDKGILDVYSPVYYTAFVVHKNGMVSSGAVVRVVAVGGESGAGEVPADNGGAGSGEGMVILDEQATTSDVYTPDYTADYRIPDISEIFLYQEAAQFNFAHDVITLHNDRDFTISIPKNAVAKSLKTILVTITDPTDSRQFYTFLLRINTDQTAYEAKIPPLSVAGDSWMKVDIYDYQSKMVSSYRKKVTFIAPEIVSEKVLFPDYFLANPEVLVLMLLLPLITLLFFLYRQNLREDNE